MARKKTAAKKPAAKKAARRKAAGKTPTVKKSAGSRVARKSSRLRSTTARTAKKRGVSLGRPRITADAELDQVFQKDYQAREVFDFLGVETVRELEEWSALQIVEKLTAPMVQTVQRIRKTLALANRCLAGDRDFALDFKRQVR